MEEVVKAVAGFVGVEAASLPFEAQGMVKAAQLLGSYVLGNCRDGVLDKGLALAKALSEFAFELEPEMNPDG